MENKYEMVLLAKGKRRHEMAKSHYDKPETKEQCEKNGWKLATEIQVKEFYGIIERVIPMPKAVKEEPKPKKEKPKQEQPTENQVQDNAQILEANI